MSTPSIPGLSGTGYKALQIPNKSSGQMDLFRQLSGGSGQNISSILQQLQGLSGGEADWEALEKPAWTDFNKGLGQIASRFSAGGGGPGAMSSRKGSGFNNATSGYAGELAERLQSNRMGLQQSAQDRLLSLYRSLLGENMFETSLIPKQKPWWQSGLEGLAGTASQLGGTAGGYGIGKKLFG